MALQSSQRLPELLFYTKKSYRILQLQFQLQFYKSIHPHTTYMCTLHSREFPIQNPILHAEDKELFEYYYIPEGKETFIPFFISTHRRQGDLLEINLCVLQDIPGIPAARPSKGIQLLQTFQSFQTFQTFRSFQSFQTFQLFMTFQPVQAILQILQCSSISRESTPFQHSPIRMLILHVLHILEFDWFPENSTEYQLGNYKHFYEHYILQRKGDVVIWVKCASVKDVKMTYFLE